MLHPDDVDEDELYHKKLSDSFYDQLLVMVLVPPAVFVIYTVIWTIGTWITKRCKYRENDDEGVTRMSLKRLFNRISIITGMTLFLIYPSICEILFQSLNCF